jgi:hypothetical protein
VNSVPKKLKFKLKVYIEFRETLLIVINLLHVSAAVLGLERCIKEQYRIYQQYSYAYTNVKSVKSKKNIHMYIYIYIYIYIKIYI